MSMTTPFITEPSIRSTSGDIAPNTMASAPAEWALVRPTTSMQLSHEPCVRSLCARAGRNFRSAAAMTITTTSQIACGSVNSTRTFTIKPTPMR